MSTKTKTVAAPVLSIPADRGWYCLDCDLVSTRPVCPGCDGRSTVPLAWLLTPTRRTYHTITTTGGTDTP